MSKKDFIALADALNESRPMFDAVRTKQWAQDVGTIRQVCAKANPQFNSERWLGYIAGTNGPSGGKI
jgi:hypothetical protein